MCQTQLGAVALEHNEQRCRCLSVDDGVTFAEAEADVVSTPPDTDAPGGHCTMCALETQDVAVPVGDPQPAPDRLSPLVLHQALH
jgi:hypothetical protein